MLTKNGLSPSVSATELWISVIGFVVLYGTLGTIDLLLMLRYSRKELPPGASSDRGRRTRSRDGVLRRPMAFVPLWFILITVLWTGFFVLEGFDMGVGMLHGVIGKDEPAGAVMSTIGPLWDGNEVWLVVAAAAMFAAFPGWYATLFSGFYLRRRPAACRAHPARGVVRVPGQEPVAALAADLEQAADRGEPAGAVPDRHDARRPAARRADRRRTTSTPAASGTCSSRMRSSSASRWSRCACCTAPPSSR